MASEQLASMTAAPSSQVGSAATAEKPRRRIKLFTVHGTFDNEAGWDNWNADEKRPDGSPRNFVNRLKQRLNDQGIDFDEVDHTQYNWSGGNSHDERRTAAIGLKKLIQNVIETAHTAHGTDYYNGGVYVVGHSHGGTISRIAMNMWDKSSNDYDPILKHTIDEELKHDDHCQVCLRERNGSVGPNTVPRPDRVFTFGSPFVTFETRKGSSLVTARLGVWLLRFLGLIPVIATYIYMLYLRAENKNALAPSAATAEDTVLEVGLQLILPILIYAVLCVSAPNFVTRIISRVIGGGTMLLVVSSIAAAIKYLGIAIVAVYYIAYLAGVWSSGTAGGWSNVNAIFPLLESKHLDDKLYWLSPVILYLILAINLPNRFLSWINHEVDHLRDRLPKKYDPRESTPLAYVSYHTAGDEAGVGLKNFSLITWIIQTLSYAAASMLIVGFLVAILIGADVIVRKAAGTGIFERVGLSSHARIVQVIDTLTLLPLSLWSLVGGSTDGAVLGKLPNKDAVAPFIPAALVSSVAKLLFITMPLALLALIAAMIVSARLRGSGKVFGSERFAWTMANEISVSRRANANTMLRKILITPEAWRQGELAHCYYYKSDAIIDDVADHIANPSKHVPDQPTSYGTNAIKALRWFVVTLFVLGIFVAAVPQAVRMQTAAVKEEAAQAARMAQTNATRVPPTPTKP